MVYNVSISTFLYIYVRCIVLYKISLLEKLCVWCVYAPYSLFTFQHQIYFYKLVQLLCFAICMYNLVLVMLHVQYNIAYYIYIIMYNVWYAYTCSSSFLQVFLHERGVWLFVHLYNLALVVCVQYNVAYFLQLHVQRILCIYM